MSKLSGKCGPRGLGQESAWEPLRYLSMSFYHLISALVQGAL